MKYQKLFKDLADAGEIRGDDTRSWFRIMKAIVVLWFFALVLGALIYGLYNASQIERASIAACKAVSDPTCIAR